MRKGISFVVPTFPAHYLNAVNFLESFYKYRFDRQSDIYFVFTNEAEKDGFLPCKSIVLPPKLRVTQNRGIINIKKYYALMQLKDQYEYIVVLDDDCQFIATSDIRRVCEEYFDSKILYGNLLRNPPFDIMCIVAEECKRFFAEPDRLTCPLYLWWNQLCIYKTDTLSDFFQITKIDRTLASLKWEDFDYYIYMYYLMLYQGFEVHDIGIVADCAFTEILPNSYVSYAAFNTVEGRFYSMTNYAKNIFNTETVFIETHLDRADEHKKRFERKGGKFRQAIGAIQMFLQVRKYIR